MTNDTLLNATPAPLVFEPDGSVVMTSAELAAVFQSADRLAPLLGLDPEAAFESAMNAHKDLFEVGIVRRHVHESGDVLYEFVPDGTVTNITSRFADLAVALVHRLSERSLEDEVLAVEQQIESHLQHVHEALLGAQEAITSGFSHIDSVNRAKK